MTISDLIETLEEIKENHGDIDIGLGIEKIEQKDVEPEKDENNWVQYGLIPSTYSSVRLPKNED